MNFQTVKFFIFCFVLFGFYWGLSNQRHRKILLLVASYTFYSFWDYRFVSLIVLSTTIDFFLGSLINDSKNQGLRKLYLSLSIVSNLGILFIFKYLNFLIESLCDAFMVLGVSCNVTTLDIILPVGISFYTFQTMSYTIDVFRGKCRVHRSPLDFALYVSFFPQLMAGPIVRARDFLPQLAKQHVLKDINIQYSLYLFLVGFFKKVCIADNLAIVVDEIFLRYRRYSTLTHWKGSVLYSIQLYCDFSGYTDMAIACAGLFGYTFSRNFAFPYLAQDYADLWRRWHISMSSWFKDYVYKPLLSRLPSGIFFTIVSLSVVMLLCGLWHGASYTFIFFGFLQALLLSALRILSLVKAGRGIARLVPSYVAVVLTYITWCVSLVFFRQNTVRDGMHFVRNLFDFNSAGKLSFLDTRIFIVVFGILATVHVISYCFEGRIQRDVASMRPTLFAFLYGIGAAVCFACAATDHRPFIYFIF